MRCPGSLRLITRQLSTRPPPVVLRPYQETCLQACTEALESGATRIGVSLPTGSGKTTVFITLLSLIKPPPEHHKATRSLVIVNSIELARQAAAQTEKLFPGWSVEIEQGSKYKASGKADLYVFNDLCVLLLTQASVMQYGCYVSDATTACTLGEVRPCRFESHHRG